MFQACGCGFIEWIVSVLVTNIGGHGFLEIVFILVTNTGFIPDKDVSLYPLWISFRFIVNLLIILHASLLILGTVPFGLFPSFWAHRHSQDSFVESFCLDEISFWRDYKSCQVGVIVVVVRATFVETLWWDNFCNLSYTFGTWYTVYQYHSALDPKFWKKSDHPNPPQKKQKKKPKKTYGFSRWDILPTL